jgi:hypothetical protein
MRRLRVATYVEDGALTTAVSRLLSENDDFDLIVRCADSRAFIDACQRLGPDLVVVDELLAADYEDVLLEAGMEAPLPALVLVEEEVPLAPEERARERRARRSRVARELLLRGDNVAGAHARTRLALVAARAGRGALKRTQSVTAVEQARALLNAGARHSNVRPEFLEVAGRGADLLVVVGDAGSSEPLRELVARLTVVHVPTLIAVAGPADDTLESVSALSQFPVGLLGVTRSIRSMEGLFVAAAGVDVSADGEVLRCRKTPSGLDHHRFIASLGSLAGRALCVVLSDGRAETLAAVGDAAHRGVAIAVLDPNIANAGRVAREASQLGYVSATGSVEELAWLLSRVVPRRL